ncbi:MAG: hypothetical protein AB2A00_16780 [Myxococcota bacterium]
MTPLCTLFAVTLLAQAPSTPPAPTTPVTPAPAPLYPGQFTTGVPGTATAPQSPGQFTAPAPLPPSVTQPSTTPTLPQPGVGAATGAPTTTVPPSGGTTGQFTTGQAPSQFTTGPIDRAPQPGAGQLPPTGTGQLPTGVTGGPMTGGIFLGAPVGPAPVAEEAPEREEVEAEISDQLDEMEDRLDALERRAHEELSGEAREWVLEQVDALRVQRDAVEAEEAELEALPEEQFPSGAAGMSGAVQGLEQTYEALDGMTTEQGEASTEPAEESGGREAAE